jgi:hypothetical protein
MWTMNQSTAAQMSVRAAMAAIVLTALVSLFSLIPDSPDRVRRTGLLWLSGYATAMLAQAAWLGWRWLSSRHPSTTQRNA